MKKLKHPEKEIYIPLIIFLAAFGFLYWTTIVRMVMQWSDDPNYSHGFIIPFISGYLLWRNKDKIVLADIKPSNWGIVVLILGLGIYFIGNLSSELFTMRFSMLIVLAGTILFTYGPERFKIALFPFLYLIFMIPLPEIIYNAIAFPLKLFVAKYSVLFLQAINITVYREGNIIMFPNIVLEVADACSGIRSLMSLVALSVAISFFVKASNLKKTVIILSAVPIAVFTNALRLIVTGILAKHWGSVAADGFFHEFAGMLVFGLAMLMLFIVGIFLREKDKPE